MVTDPARALYYRPAEVTMSGDRIYQTVLQANSTMKECKMYELHMKQMHWLKDQFQCTEYGQEGSKYDSYAACVEEEDRREILPLLNCMIPWMSASDHCTKILNKTPEHALIRGAVKSRLLKALAYVEYLSEACLPPCIRTDVQSRYLGSYTKVMPKNMINLYFDPTVKASSEEVAYGPTDLLVEIGSSLGLWLGLSSVSLFDMSLALIEHVNHNFWHKN